VIASRLCLVVCIAATVAACGSQSSLRQATPSISPTHTAFAPTGPPPTATPEPLACRLPVYQGAANAQSAGFVSLPSGAFQADPGATGNYYDWPLHRWLWNNGAVSPDGLQYAEAGPVGIQVVDLVTGKSRVFPTAADLDLGSVLYFAREGIYLGHTPGRRAPGLWLLDPNSGKIKAIFTDQPVEAVGGFAAWIPQTNPADQHPFRTPDGILPNQVVRRDLNTNDTRVWFYRPGSNVQVLGFTADKQPLVLVETGSGPSDSIWLVPQANQGSEVYSGSGQFRADRVGVWISGSDGIYVWRHGNLTKASNYVGLVAGSCQ
jgi:hypothetical protein